MSIPEIKVAREKKSVKEMGTQTEEVFEQGTQTQEANKVIEESRVVEERICAFIIKCLTTMGEQSGKTQSQVLTLVNQIYRECYGKESATGTSYTRGKANATAKHKLSQENVAQEKNKPYGVKRIKGGGKRNMVDND